MNTRMTIFHVNTTNVPVYILHQHYQCTSIYTTPIQCTNTNSTFKKIPNKIGQFEEEKLRGK